MVTRKPLGNQKPGTWVISAALGAILLIGAAAVRSAPAASPVLGGCPVLPADNIWNTPVDTLPVDANSDAYINAIGVTANVHADFGSGVWPLGSNSPIGIPYIVVPADQPLVNINWTAYGDQSDPGPYPVPTAAPIEGGPDLSNDGDRHVLVVRQGECKLYELYRAFPQADGSWNADSGAVYTLTLNGPLRPDGWTSADAAGLPMLPGLVRYDEVAAGELNHAIRFTAPQTRDTHLWPARHDASSLTSTQVPPMGQRFRLKASFAIDSRFSPEVQVILRALKKYGLILADNGSAWYLGGAPDDRWVNDDLHQLDQYVSGSDFEAVDESSLMVDPNSGQAIDHFVVSAQPGSNAIPIGSSAANQLIIEKSLTFSGAVNLSAVSPSPSLMLSFPTLATPPITVTLRVTDTHPPGFPATWYTIPITATGSGVTRTLSVGLLVGGVRVYLPIVLKQ